jgi:hypothetical protein
MEHVADTDVRVQKHAWVRRGIDVEESKVRIRVLAASWRVG